MNLVSKLEETASQKPEKPACLFQDQYMTYEELAGKIKAFANGLEDRGLKKGIISRCCSEIRLILLSRFSAR